MTEAPEDAAPATRARRLWSPRALAIVLGVPALGIAALVALREPAPTDPRYSVTDRQEAESKRARDPLAAELARCRTLAADQVDEHCQTAWEVNRRRFYGESRSLAIPKADAPAAELPAIDPHARNMEP
jgi:conjugative transfer region protein TrbK